jgi:predicted alpha/beta-hydrolase family hydrolase
MTEDTWAIPVGDDSTTAAFDPAASNDTVFVCAHGAGGSISDRNTLGLAKALGARGIHVVRFNFLYREKGSGRPDPMPKLEKCFTAVVERVRSELSPKRLFIGGRSMGGRAASMLASEGFGCDGLMLFAYPLHPPGQPDKLRDAHLPSITMPVICFNGTRDPFCTPALMKSALAKVTAPWEMHWIDDADHSFHVPRSSGRTDAQVLSDMADAVATWIT